MEEFKRLIALAVKKKASDVHLVAGAVPYFRIHRILYPVKKPATTQKTLEAITRSLLSQEQAKKLEQLGGVDLGVALEGVLLRINIHRQTSGLGMAVRILPEEVPDPKDINMPDKVLEIASMKEGFVIVSGPAGSGKSTELAALVEVMNKTKPLHIKWRKD